MFKRLLFLLMLTAPLQTVFAQTMNITVHAFYPPAAMNITGHPVIVEVIPDSLSPYSISGTFNSFGVFITSISHPGANATIISRSINCDGTYVYSTPDTIDSTTANLIDSVNISCPSTGTCNADFSVNQIANLTYNFTDQSNPLTSVNSYEIYLWDFGDTNFSNLPNPVHSYQLPGLYQVCMEIISMDSTFGYELCRDTICRTIAVNDTASGQCNGGFSYTSDSSGFTSFTNLSSFSGFMGVNTDYTWYFGDGAISSGIQDPDHQYSAPGIYQVCMVLTIHDTLTNLPLCTDSICQNIIIPETLSCSSSYVIDSVNSYTGTVYIWNMYEPDPINSSTAFLWSFGDGSTSTDPYPTHTYAAAGMYNVCLQVSRTSNDSLYENCSETWCDSLGVDEDGKLLFKNGGWTLNVLDPRSIGIEEVRLVQSKLYPNPGNGLITLEFTHENKNFDLGWELQDMNGRSLKTGSIIVEQNKVHKLDFRFVPAGIYFLVLESGDEVWYHKLVLDL